MEITTHKKRYLSPEERQQVIDELRLVSKIIKLLMLKILIALQCIKNGVPKNCQLVRQCTELTI